jgi:hypothetical protein
VASLLGGLIQAPLHLPKVSPIYETGQSALPERRESGSVFRPSRRFGTRALHGTYPLSCGNPGEAWLIVLPITNEVKCCHPDPG